MKVRGDLLEIQDSLLVDSTLDKSIMSVSFSKDTDVSTQVRGNLKNPGNAKRRGPRRISGNKNGVSGNKNGYSSAKNEKMQYFDKSRLERNGTFEDVDVIVEDAWQARVSSLDFEITTEASDSTGSYSDDDENWDKPDWVRQQRSLRWSEHGKEMKEGKTLSKAVTHIQKELEEDEEAAKKLGWQKPDWTERPSLKTTDVGKSVRAGKSLAKEVTHIRKVLEEDEEEAKKIGWQKPDWAEEKKLKSTRRGNAAKLGRSLTRKAPGEQGAVDSDDNQRPDISWEKPDWSQRPRLRNTDTGQLVRRGKNLAREVTHIKKVLENDEEEAKKIGWEKPDWAERPSLKQTEKGKSVRKGKNLAREVTHIKKSLEEDEETAKKIGWEKPNWAAGDVSLKSSDHGQELRTKGKDLRARKTTTNGGMKASSHTARSRLSGSTHDDYSESVGMGFEIPALGKQKQQQPPPRNGLNSKQSRYQQGAIPNASNSTSASFEHFDIIVEGDDRHSLGFDDSMDLTSLTGEDREDDLVRSVLKNHPHQLSMLSTTDLNQNSSASFASGSLYDEVSLRSSQRGLSVRMGESLESSISNIREQAEEDEELSSKIGWEKPEWTTRPTLKSTAKGQNARKGKSLAKEVTHIKKHLEEDEDSAKKLGWEKPDWTKKSKLKETDKGKSVRKGKNLAKAVTHINRQLEEDEESAKKLGWEKPDWAEKPALKETDVGREVKRGRNLAREITHINRGPPEERRLGRSIPGRSNPDHAGSRLQRSNQSNVGLDQLRGALIRRAGSKQKEKEQRERKIMD